MKISKASRSLLLSELYESKKMIFRIVNLPEPAKNYVIMSVSPFLSLLCVGIDDLFSDDSKLSEGYGSKHKLDFANLVAKNRSSIKLLTDKNISKAITIIDQHIFEFNMHLQKNYNWIQKSFISMFGQPDLGVYYYKGIPFSNTCQMSIYTDMFHTTADRNFGEVIRDFSELQFSFINQMVLMLEDKKLPRIEGNKLKSNLDYDDFSSRDFIFYNRKKRNIFVNIEDKSLALFLFNLKCQLSFVINILPSIVSFENSLKYRIEMITYYHSVKTITFLIKKGRFPAKPESKTILDRILSNFNNFFSENNLRNNLYHYELSKDNLSMNFSGNYFVNMVEYQTKQNFDSVVNIMTNDIIQTIEVIDKILN